MLREHVTLCPLPDCLSPSSIQFPSWRVETVLHWVSTIRMTNRLPLLLRLCIEKNSTAWCGLSWREYWGWFRRTAMGKGRKHIRTHVRWFLPLYLSKVARGQVSVYNPKPRSNFIGAWCQGESVATRLALNYVGYSWAIIIREFCKPTILKLILVF